MSNEAIIARQTKYLTKLSNTAIDRVTNVKTIYYHYGSLGILNGTIDSTGG